MYPDDFEADTAHLSLAEDGAYNRLLRLQWRSPGCKIPNDLPWVMRKMRAISEADQALVEGIIKEFFTRKAGKIFSARLLKEWVQAVNAHEKRILAGSKGGNAKSLKIKDFVQSNATAMLKQPEPEPEPEPEEKKEGGGGSAGASKNAISGNPSPTFREQILTAAGADRVSGLTGPNGKRIGTQADMAEAGKWINDLGLTEAECLAEIIAVVTAKRDGPPTSFRYFSPAMTRLAAAKVAPPMQPATPTTAQPIRKIRAQLPREATQ
jgi:uncharacterized protein YdaU (DUF1376 family)